jgi:outer membrane protein
VLSTAVFGQRYGVVDTDYILKSLPEYAQAKSQIDKLSEQWAGEVSALQSELESLKDALDAERILLSPEKLEKREEGIEAKQAEVIALQQKYFGPEGQLFEKRNQLVQPIQDKVLVLYRQWLESVNWNWSLTKVPKAVFCLSIRTRTTAMKY